MKRVFVFVICLLTYGFILSQRVPTPTIREQSRTSTQRRQMPQTYPKQPQQHTPVRNKPQHRRHNGHQPPIHYDWHHSWRINNHMWYGYWNFIVLHNHHQNIYDKQYVIYDVVFDDNFIYTIIHEKNTLHNHLLITNQNDQVLIKHQIKKKYKKIRFISDFLIIGTKDDESSDVERYIYDSVENKLYMFELFKI